MKQKEKIRINRIVGVFFLMLSMAMRIYTSLATKTWAFFPLEFLLLWVVMYLVLRTSSTIKIRMSVIIGFLVLIYLVIFTFWWGISSFSGYFYMVLFLFFHFYGLFKLRYYRITEINFMD